MDPKTIICIVGCIFVFISIIGGNIDIRGILNIKDEIDKKARFLSFILGLFLILGSFDLLPTVFEYAKRAMTFQLNTVSEETASVQPDTSTKSEEVVTEKDKHEKIVEPPPNPPKRRETVKKDFGTKIFPPSPSSASISSNEKFVTCQGVVNKNPHNISDSFGYEKVYVWAQIRSSKPETVKLVWIDPRGNKNRERRLDIGVNMGDGYRIYDYKLFHPGEEGNWQACLYNQNNDLISRREFNIQQ